MRGHSQQDGVPAAGGRLEPGQHSPAAGVPAARVPAAGGRLVLCQQEYKPSASPPASCSDQINVSDNVILVISLKLS